MTVSTALGASVGALIGGLVARIGRWYPWLCSRLCRAFVMLQVRDDAVVDPERFYIDAAKLDLIGRIEGALYARTRGKFEPSVALGQALLAKHTS